MKIEFNTMNDFTDFKNHVSSEYENRPFMPIINWTIEEINNKFYIDFSNNLEEFITNQNITEN
jgi:hypothetical protein